MKKLLIISAILLILSSCGSEVRPDIVFEEKHVERANTKKNMYVDGTLMYTRHFIYQGHTYIEFFRNLPSYDNYTGFEHDPACLERDIKRLLDEVINNNQTKTNKK
jgi:hypothetical protein